jgi:nitroimidazol reductase NimA-like FMN-containing flavoprotein (pyridoxamine 5'-phosphate oxidase superfamily)
VEKSGEQSKRILASLLGTQKLAVLSTYSGGQPYVSLVAFAESEDLGYLLFATDRDTRKFANILEHPRVAMLVDNRSNRESDFGEASAVTILGEAREPGDGEKEMCLKLYLEKHPYLGEFVKSAKCALVRVKVETFLLVDRFQEVTRLDL